MSSIASLSSIHNIKELLADSIIQEQIERRASQYCIPLRDLSVKTYLHLPRFSPEELGDFTVIDCEIARLASIIRANYQSPSLPALGYDLRDAPLENFVLDHARREDTEVMIGKLHYLNSVRTDSFDLSLIYKPAGYAVGIISISPYDLTHVSIGSLPSEQVRVFSRIYTIPNLPHNAPSYFIGKATKWVRDGLPSVRLLLTYLNPNVGFTGTIYKATNWQDYAREYYARYNYLDGNYVTDRFLQLAFGTADAVRLLAMNIPNLIFSQIELGPLKLLALPLDGHYKLPAIQDVRLR